MDKLIYVVGIIGVIMTLPQLTKIWMEKNASGVSIVSWGAYAILAIFWIIYGVMHKEKPIILTYSAWFVIDTLIVIGLLIYG